MPNPPPSPSKVARRRLAPVPSRRTAVVRRTATQPLAEQLDATPDIETTVFADVVGTRLRARRIYQRYEGLSPEVVASDHTLGLQLAGGAGLERHEGGRMVAKTDQVRSAGLIQAHVPARWLVPPEGVDVLHLHLEDARFRKLVEAEAHDPARIELIDRIGQDDRFLAAFAPAVLHELRTPGPASALMIDSFDSLVTEHMLRAYSVQSERHRQAEERDALRREETAVARAQELLLARIEENVGLEAIAAEVGLSPFVLRRHFTRLVGMPPHAWLTSRRLLLARDLLAGPKPLVEIALACGFSSQSHMTDVFRRHYGVTPGAFRREIAL